MSEVPGGLMEQLAEFGRWNEGVIPTLLAMHRPDRHGRCRVCRGSGDGAGMVRWPCTSASTLAAIGTKPLRLVRQPE